MKEKLLLMAASLLGFATACENQKTVMYGTPYIDYTVKGKVTDKAGKAIPGIEVGASASELTTTDDNGAYVLSGTSWPCQADLTFTDIDGPVNGEFAEKQVTVEFTEADRTGKGGGWSDGSFARTDIDVTLDEKE